MRINRRKMLFSAATGFGGLALFSHLANSQSPSAKSAADQAKVSNLAGTAKAKSVIFLYMEGGPSQVDTFDPKPRLHAENGQHMKLDVPLRLARERVLESAFKFHRYGESGLEVSELFPHVGRCADHLAVIRSMVAKHGDHGTANVFMNTGSSLRGRPSMGSWFSYGLSAENENLPMYVVMNEGDQLSGGPDSLNNGFLPQRFAPTLLKSGKEPLPNLTPRDASPELQQRKISAIRRLDEAAVGDQGGNDQLDSIIQNYELAFRMQSAVLEAVDVSAETPATRKLYGLDDPLTELFGTRCLRARRLVERGVRFIQIVSPALGDDGAMIRWDQHVEIVRLHRKNALLVDKPIAGLLTDLIGRGLLDQTIVIWGGEFGRTPTAQSNFPSLKVGRDHNPFGFSMWLAGGGIKGGIVHGATDEYGLRAVEKPMTVHDLHATVLHQCGIDHTELTYRHGGRDFRLTDVYGEVVEDILA